ncbi:Mob1/phocein, partial [Mrakia frigida]|uniref:Mob1/phocein n=1 Tax=Mrakia frigida TaxID=29902 RepID=UPI003FCC0283
DPPLTLFSSLSRRLPPDLTPLITSLLTCCTPETCPDMRAGEWQYLCAAHPRLADCAAVDYVLHALDSITSMLNSSRVFPSRLSIPSTSRQNLKNIARRLSRIFGHAYSFHREVF